MGLMLDESCKENGSVKPWEQVPKEKYKPGGHFPKARQYSAHPLLTVLHVFHATSYFVTKDIEHR